MIEPSLPNLLLTLDEVAVSLRISKSKAKKLVAAHEIRSVQVGRLRRVRASDLNSYVAGLAATNDQDSGQPDTPGAGIT